MACAFSKVSDLLAELELDAAGLALPEQILDKFPLRVPRGFVSRMKKGDYRDPLLLQVLPVAAEARRVPGYTSDPVGDLPSARGRGMLQKYHGRALLIVTGACGIHCRYCFRRAYPYDEAAVASGRIDTVIQALDSDPSVEEVILSGGDPLSLSDERLAELLSALARVPHLKRIRIHTRMPVVLPERVDQGLLSVLSQASKPLIFVLHCNHANEIDQHVADAVNRLRRHAFMLLNQSVLLRRINDSAAALAALSERLFDVGVIPYYLHQLDPVQGAAHFEVDDQTACDLLSAASARLPGYLVPRLVREIPGASAKVPIIQTRTAG